MTSRTSRGSTAAAVQAVPESVGSRTSLCIDEAARRAYDEREYGAAMPGAQAALRQLQQVLTTPASTHAAVARAAGDATLAIGRLWDAARRLAEPQ